MATAGYLLLNTRALGWLVTLMIAQTGWTELDPMEVIFAWEKNPGKWKRKTSKPWWNEVGLQ